MTRTLAYSLYQICDVNKWEFRLWSAYDADADLMPQYLPAKNFKGFGSNRINFVAKTLSSTTRKDIVIISHINLAIIGLIVKIINPKCQIWLIAHGIEVWRPISLLKRLFLKRCDKILCVSNFTKV